MKTKLHLLIRTTSGHLTAPSKRLTLASHLVHTSLSWFSSIAKIPQLKLILLAGLTLLTLGGVGRESNAKVPLLEQVASWPGYGRGPAMAVAVEGRYAFVAAGPGGLIVLDVSDPAHPIRVGEYWTPGTTRCVQVQDSRAYVARTVRGGGGCNAETRGRLEVLDVSAPAQPKLLGSYATSQEIKDLQIVGQRAYLALYSGGFNNGEGLQIIDLSDPAHPVGLGGRAFDVARSVHVSGNRVCVAGGSTLRMADGNIPPQGEWAATVTVTNQAQAVWVEADFAYLAWGGTDPDSQGGLTVFDLDLPVESIATITTAKTLLDLQLAGTYAYVAAGEDGLLVFDVSSPRSPKLVGRYDTPGCAVGVMISGRYVYVADYDGGLQIIDRSDPVHPVLVSSFDTGLTTRQAQVVANLACVLSWDRHEQGVSGKSRLEVVDVTNRTRPVLLGTYETAGVVQDYGFNGGIVCWLRETKRDSGDWRLEVLDLRIPTQPQVVGTLPFQGWWSESRICLSGTYAYISGNGVLQVFDLKNPASPRKVGEGYPWYDVFGVQVQGGYAYVVTSSGIAILDVTNPAQPVVKNTLSDQNNRDAGSGVLCLVGNIAYVALARELAIVNVQDPTNAVPVGSYALGNSVLSVAVADRFAFLAEGTAGVEVVDVSNPAQLVGLPGWREGSGANSVQARDGFVYVGDAGLGLVVLRLHSNDLVIVQGPPSQTMVAGGQAALTVSATGLEPLAYQWYWGQSGDISRPIEGATAASYTTPALGAETELWVRVSSGGQWVDSSAARLSVAPAVAVERIGTWPGYRMGSIAAVQVVGAYAYVVAGTGGLMVFDVSNPIAPQRVGGYYDTNSNASSVAVSGNYAYIAGQGWWDQQGQAWRDNLLVIDISNPIQPRRVGGRDSTESPQTQGISVTVAGNYAYFAAGDWVDATSHQHARLEVLDISNPALPKQVGSYVASAAICSRVAISGNYAYLAETHWDQPGWLEVLDISNPARPAPAGRYNSPGRVSGVVVAGNYAYLAGGQWDQTGQFYRDGLQVLDISNPSNVQRIGACHPTGFASSVAVIGNYAYLTAGMYDSQAQIYRDVLQVVDISNPANPRRVGGYDSSDCPSFVYFAAPYAYTAFAWGLGILDVSDPAQPKWTGGFNTYRPVNTFFVTPPYAYVTPGLEGLDVYDVNNPARPCPVGSYKMGSAPLDLVVNGSYAYVTADNLEVLDVSNPAQPRPVGALNGVSGAMTIAGNHVFVAGVGQWNDVAQTELGAGLITVDLSNPASPQRLGSFYTPRARAVAVLGQYTYLASAFDGLAVFDISHPSTPVRVGTYYPDGEVEDVCISGHYAYLAVAINIERSKVGDGGLEILDLSEPSRPVRVARILSGQSSHGLGVAGRYVLVIVSDARFPAQTSLEVVDISNPAQPVVVGQFEAPEASEVMLDGDRVYLAQGSYGVTILRVAPQVWFNTPVVASGKVKLSWLGGSGFKLQKSSSLSPAIWQDVPGSEGVSQIELPLETAAAFFRLIGAN